MAAIGNGTTIWNGLGNETTSNSRPQATLHCEGHGPQVPERVCPGCFQNLKDEVGVLVREREKIILWDMENGGPLHDILNGSLDGVPSLIGAVRALLNQLDGFAPVDSTYQIRPELIRDLRESLEALKWVPKK